MNKLTKAFRALSQIIRKPTLLNLVLDDNDLRRKYIVDKYHGLEGFPQLPLTSLTGSTTETISPFAFLDGGSLPTDLALLKGLARQFKDCSYFEIGTWRGESVTNVSMVAKECITMDLPDDEKLALGYDDYYISQHALFSKHLSSVTHLKANSLTFDFASLNRKFDLVFIDGDHHYANVLNDTQKVFKHLLHENSIVVWHDFAFNPEKVRYKVMAAILDGCPPTLHGHLYHVANTLCAVYMKNLPIKSKYGERETFEVTVRSI
jgi:predicted O-methyltransferase YrrM